MSIVRATENEMDAIFDLIYELVEESHQLEPDFFKLPQKDEKFKSFIERALHKDNKDMHFFLKFADGTAVGCIHYYIIRMPESPYVYTNSFLFVETLVVKKKHRNNGYARELLNHAAEHAKKMDVARIEANIISKKIKTKGFYERLGFATVRETMRLNLDD